MTVDSRMLDIIRKIGEVAPPPIRLSKLFESQEQDFFSFSLPVGHAGVLAKVLDLLGRSGANIRFLGERFDGEGELRVQMSVDSDHGADALKAFRSEEVQRPMGELHHSPAAVILSLYPFNGQPQIAERIFGTLLGEGIEILGAGAATSVFSCVILRKNAESAVSALKRAFVLL